MTETAMKRKPKAAKLIKTSVSVPEVLMQFALKECEREGHNSFSSYLSSLIRADRDRKITGAPPHLDPEIDAIANAIVADEAKAILNSAQAASEPSRTSRKREAAEPALQDDSKEGESADPIGSKEDSAVSCSKRKSKPHARKP